MNIQATLTAAIAVLGTLLGSTVTYLFQRKSFERAEAFAFHQQLRTERMTAYSDFANAITEYSRGQHKSWRKPSEEATDDRTYLDARAEAHKLGSAAYQALCRIRLVADDEKLITAAYAAYELEREVGGASTEADLQVRIKKGTEALFYFIEIASRDVQRRRVAS